MRLGNTCKVAVEEEGKIEMTISAGAKGTELSLVGFSALQLGEVVSRFGFEEINIAKWRLA